MDFKRVFRIVALIFIGIVVGIFSTQVYQKIKEPKQTITVVGTGEIDATTDQATISIQVSNKTDAQKLKQSLLDLGVPESRITQNSYNPPIYQIQGAPSSEMMIYPRPTAKPSTTVNFTVVLDSIKNIEKVFEVINTNLNTQITNTYYSLNNQKTWESKAKEAALQDARTQAETAAKINHLKVGRLVSVTEEGSAQPFIAPMLKGAVSEQANQANDVNGNNSTFYSEQTVKINASYTVQYELYSPLFF